MTVTVPSETAVGRRLHDLVQRRRGHAERGDVAAQGRLQRRLADAVEPSSTHRRRPGGALQSDTQLHGARPTTSPSTLGQVVDANFAAPRPTRSTRSTASSAPTTRATRSQSGAPIDTVDPGHALARGRLLQRCRRRRRLAVDQLHGRLLHADAPSRRPRPTDSSRSSRGARRQARGRGDLRQEGDRHDQGLTVASRGPPASRSSPRRPARSCWPPSRARPRSVKLQVAFTPQAIGTGDSEISPAARRS